MAEYIERDKGMDIGTLEDWYINSIDTTVPPIWTIEHLEELLEDFIVIPKETPAADVRPERHGRWEIDTNGGFRFVKCSECGKHPRSNLEEPFCPWCGAVMNEKGGKSNAT